MLKQKSNQQDPSPFSDAVVLSHVTLGAAQHRAGTGSDGEMGESSRKSSYCSEPEGRCQIQPYWPCSGCHTGL